MFLLSGLLGLLLAGASIGFLPEAVTRDDTGGDDDDPAPEAGDETAAGDLLDDVPPLPDAAPQGRIIGGTELADDLAGTPGADQANGLDGNDTLSGDDGRDVLWGGAGQDVLLGGAGDDALGGEDGDDLILGGTGADTLSGFMGHDTLSGEAGADLLLGGAGDDLLDGGAGDDTLEGHDGADTLTGGAGADELFGGKGDDLLDGRAPGLAGDEGPLTAPRDFLNGGKGADTLIGDADDWLHGGEDADLFALAWAGEAAPLTLIEDYDPEQDRIAVVMDVPEGAAPEISVAPSDGTEGAAWVLVNGIRIAEVLNGAELSAADIALMSPRAFAAL
jgi:Ca2+-binding RTX toxin-like protein